MRGSRATWRSHIGDRKSEGPPSLNLEKLARAGALEPGRTGDWQWTRDGVSVARISLRAETGRIALLYRFQNSSGACEIVRETVRIARRSSGLGGRELSFLCPGRRNGIPCRRRVANLYGAGRYFLCRHCAQLAHSSSNHGEFTFLRSQPVRACAAVAGLGAFVISADALAAGFLIRENSATAVATVSAGNGSRADSASTAFNNPAGMMRLMGNDVEIGTVVILPSVEFNGSATAFGAPVPGTNGGDAGKAVVIPNLFWTFDITNRLKGGIAVTAPFGMGTEYDSQWSGRYLGIKTSSLTADINPNIAFRVNDSLSLGVGVSAQYFKLDATSAIAQFVMFGAGAPDALYRFKADDWAFGFNLGALLELEGGTRVGLTYRSGIDHRIEGSLDFTGANPLLGMVSGPAAADVNLPATTGLSLTSDVNPDLSLSADVQFSQWSVFKEVVIESQNPPVVLDQNYRDSWMIAIGGVYRLNNVWTLRGGLAWDQTPVTDQFRAVNLPDEDRYLAGIGFGYRMTDRLSLDGGYQHAFAAENASMNSSANATDPVTHAVTLAGKYNVAVDLLALSLRFKY